MTQHQTPPIVTDEMVERAAIRLCALDLGNENFWKTIDEDDRNTYRDEARDVLTAALAVQPGSGVPKGWKLVPVEPTPQMRQAFHAAHEEYEGGSGVAPDLQWQAMLAAAPTPPTAQEGK